MAKESDVKPITPNYMGEAVPLVIERKYTMGRRLRRIITIAIYALVVLLAYCIGNFHGWKSREALILKSGVYVYDTEQKLEDFYTMFERDFFDKTGFPPESPEAREFAVLVRKGGRPLVAVGPFAVFVEDDSGRFSVREIRSLMPLVELERNGQSKHLVLSSLLEKGSWLPRFQFSFFYSEEGIYKGGNFSVNREDGTVERLYMDTKKTGVFDVMHILDYEDGITNKYRLNGLSWERYATREWAE